MKIAVIVAMQKELALMEHMLENAKRTEVIGRPVLTGKIGRHEVALMQCGIGKVNAALGASYLIDMFKPDLVMNSGVAGGASKKVHPLSVVVAETVAYHDVWCGPGTLYGAAADLEPLLAADAHALAAARSLPASKEALFGLICSGDKFISKASEVKQIRKDFPEALAVDMESGAIAQTCRMRGVPFFVVRVISDTPGEADNISQYQNFWNDAPSETFRFLQELIDKL